MSFFGTVNLLSVLYDLDDLGKDIPPGTTFLTSEVTVAHESNSVVVYSQDTMKDIRVSNLGQNNIQWLYVFVFYKHDAVLISANEREHAGSLRNEGYLSPLIYESADLCNHSMVCYDFLLHQHPSVTDFEHTRAASSFGRHSIIHDGTVLMIP